MQKVVAFLEKHVQWVAIALGGVYLLWMVWSYVLNSPVTVTTADGTKLTPGKVDQKVYADTATKLETAIKNERASIAITTPDLNNVLVAFNQPAQLPALASNIYNSVTVPIGTPGTTDQNPSGPAVANNSAKVDTLPKPKPATDLQLVHGRSSVVVPPVVANTAPGGGGAGAAAGAVAEGGPVAQPAAASNAPVPVGADGKPIGTDLDWVTLSCKLPLADLAKQFADCKIPAVFKTSYIDFQLVRQEKQTSGDWGPETVVPLLTIHQGNGRPTVPTTQANQNVIQGYLLWAIPNAPVLLQPTFYTVLKGDAWQLPGVQPAAVAQQQAQPAENFDPNREYTPAEMAQLTPDQKRL